MTTGEYLVANSPLPSGTALSHFMALQFGGTGPGETVFASRFSVVTGESRIDVTQRAKRNAPEDNKQPRKEETVSSGKAAFAFLPANSMSVFSGPPDEVFVTLKQNTALATKDFCQITITHKKGQK